MKQLQIKYRPLLKEEKIEVLFLFQAGTVWASLESVYQACLEDERFDVKLALVKEMTVETSHMQGARSFLKNRGMVFCDVNELDFSVYCPHVVFIQFPYDLAFHTPNTLSIRFQRRGSRVVYVPYGIEISDTQIARKDHFSSFVVENSWRVYTSSFGLKEEYDKYCRNREAVRVTGSPKFDAICRKNSLPLAAEIMKEKGQRKLVIWKMHFPKKCVEKGITYQITPYVKEYIEFAKQLKEFDDFYFVVLAHPKMLRGVVASDIQGDETLMQQVKELLQVCSETENVFIDATEDYRNSFYHADAIIMDRSAVMIEAAMLNVPVLLMKNEDYYEPMTRPVEEVCNSFLQGTGCADMRKFMEQLRLEEDSQREAREYAISRNFPFADGLCGERIKEDIVNSLKEAQQKPKIIIYGTGEICRYYMEQQNIGCHEKFDVVAIADSNSTKWGKEYYGFKIISPDEIKSICFDAIVIATEPHYFEIKKSLVYDMCLDERKIWRLDEFVVELE